MDEKLFEKLIESASQAAKIARGDRSPAWTFEQTSDIPREIRKSTRLSQEWLRHRILLRRPQDHACCGQPRLISSFPACREADPEIAVCARQCRYPS